MARDFRNDPVRTQDELLDASRSVDAGRKGGAVSSAPYSEEGPLAARGYDMTSATSTHSRAMWLVPLLLIALFVAFLVMSAIRAANWNAREGATNAPSAATGSVQNGAR